MQVDVYGRSPIMPPGAGGATEPWVMDADGRQGHRIFSADVNVPNPPATITVEVYQGWKVVGTPLNREVTLRTIIYRRVKLVAGVSAIYMEEVP